MRRKAVGEKAAGVGDEGLPAAQRHVSGRPVRIEPGETIGPLPRDAAVMLDRGAVCIGRRAPVLSLRPSIDVWGFAQLGGVG
jgi:hypothetical protein